MNEEQDDLYKALGSKSMRDFYDKVAYLGSDTEAELTDGETDDDNDVDDESDDANNDTDDNRRVIIANNTFRTPITPVLTKHPGFPNLKYLHLGACLGSAKFRYFCHKAEGGDHVHNLF